MDTLKFKTTINCGACVAKVTPVLNEQENISSWSVDTENPEKVLTVKGEDIDETDLVRSLLKIGYKAEKI